MLPHLLTCEVHDIDLILVLIEIEHVAYLHITSFNHFIKGERSVERDVGTGNLQLQVMDEITEGTAAEIAVAGVDSLLEHADLTVDIVIDTIYICLEMVHELFVNGEVGHADHLSCHLFIKDPSIFHRNLDLGIAHHQSYARRVEAYNNASLVVGDDVLVLRMVMTVENQVEPGYFLGYSQ